MSFIVSSHSAELRIYINLLGGVPRIHFQLFTYFISSLLGKKARETFPNSISGDKKPQTN